MCGFVRCREPRAAPLLGHLERSVQFCPTRPVRSQGSLLQHAASPVNTIELTCKVSFSSQQTFQANLNNVPRHCTHVCPAMASNFCLVVHASQRHSCKLSANGTGNALPQRCFTHTRRSNQAQD